MESAGSRLMVGIMLLLFGLVALACAAERPSGPGGLLLLADPSRRS
jgi:hypothetical protein